MAASSEQRYLKRQLTRNTIITFLALSLVLSLLGAFLYGWVSSSLFKTVDSFLDEVVIVDGSLPPYPSEGADEGAETPDAADLDAADPDAEAGDGSSTTETGADESPSAKEEENAAEGLDAASAGADGAEEAFDDTEALFDDGEATPSLLDAIGDNPQFFYLIRNDDGSIVATISQYYVQDGIIDDVGFDPKETDSPKMVQAGGHAFRTMTHRIESEGSARYLQAAANVDSEVSILHGFIVTLSIGYVVALILCAAASYLLSRRVLKPVGEAWEKQAEFVRSASHELRTPLAVIKTNQELLLEHPQDRIVDHFEKIAAAVDEADRLGRLATDLLSLSALDAGGAALDRRPLDMNELVRAVSSVYEDYALVQEKDFSAECPAPTFVEGDEKRLRQLLSILLDNAFKYTGAGDSILLCVERLPRRVRVSVRDTGIGIPEADLPFVFDRFFRSDRARSTETGGEGLGLAIAKSIVEAHDGSISISANAPQGTERSAYGHGPGVCITFEMPATSAQPVPPRP